MLYAAVHRLLLNFVRCVYRRMNDPCHIDEVGGTVSEKRADCLYLAGKAFPKTEGHVGHVGHGHIGQVGHDVLTRKSSEKTSRAEFPA